MSGIYYITIKYRIPNLGIESEYDLSLNQL